MWKFREKNNYYVTHVSIYNIIYKIKTWSWQMVWIWLPTNTSLKNDNKMSNLFKLYMKSVEYL